MVRSVQVRIFSHIFVQVRMFPLNMRDIIIHVAPWWEKYLSKRSLIKHTSWRDKLVKLWTLNREPKIFLRIWKMKSCRWLSFQRLKRLGKIFHVGIEASKKCNLFWLKQENARATIIHKISETLVFMWNSALREMFGFCFWRVFVSINKISILSGRGRPGGH